MQSILVKFIDLLIKLYKIEFYYFQVVLIIPCIKDLNFIQLCSMLLNLSTQN